MFDIKGCPKQWLFQWPDRYGGFCRALLCLTDRLETDGNFIKIFDGLALLGVPAPCTADGARDTRSMGRARTMCPGSTAWTAEDQSGVEAWLKGWSSWLTASPFSNQALTFFNNHNTWLRSAWFVVAAWTADWSQAVDLLNGAKTGTNSPIGGQSKAYSWR